MEAQAKRGDVQMQQLNMQSKGSNIDDAALQRLGKKAVLKVRSHTLLI